MAESTAAIPPADPPGAFRQTGAAGDIPIGHTPIGGVIKDPVRLGHNYEAVCKECGWTTYHRSFDAVSALLTDHLATGHEVLDVKSVEFGTGP